MEIKYKFECYWSEIDGWNFSFGNKRLWQKGDGTFVVADLKNDKYQNHEKFDILEDGLDYMRTE